MASVRKIIRDAAAQDYRMSAFLQGVIESPAFQRVRAPVEPAATTTAPVAAARN
jgi:hypothetical protein